MRAMPEARDTDAREADVLAGLRRGLLTLNWSQNRSPHKLFGRGDWLRRRRRRCGLRLPTTGALAELRSGWPKARARSGQACPVSPASPVRLEDHNMQHADEVRSQWSTAAVSPMPSPPG